MMTLILLHWSQTLRFFTILTPPEPRQSQPDEVAQAGPLFPVLILAPLAGLVSAPLAALAGWLALAASFPPITAGLVALFCLIWISGGLHEDGLGDYMDGIGAGGTAHARLSVMRDSRIGAYGAIGLIMAIGLQAGLIGQIGDQTGLAGFMAVMLACELSGRSWFGLALMRLKPIDDTGLAAAFACNGADGFHRWYLYLTWLVFAVVIAGLVSPTGLLGIAGAQIVIFYGWLRLTRKHLGGLNGDCLGALMIFQRLGALATLVAMNASMMVQIP